MSYLNIAIFSGIGCGPIIGGLLSDSWGLPSVFYTMACLSFVAFVLVILYMPGQVASDHQMTAKTIAVEFVQYDDKWQNRRDSSGQVYNHDYHGAQYGIFAPAYVTMAEQQRRADWDDYCLQDPG